MRALSVALLYLLVSLTSAAPSGSKSSFKGSEHEVKESIIPPRGWSKQQVAPADLTINLRIALPQPSFSVLEQHLYEISDPSHSRYGAHLSKEEVEALVAPHPESLNLVDQWLVSHGLSLDALTRSPANDWVRVDIPVSLAEKMLETKYYIWIHEQSGKTALRTTSYSLPQNLHAHIDVIHPTTFFPSTKRMNTHSRFTEVFKTLVPDDEPAIIVPTASGGKVAASCNNNITISCLQQLYNAVGYEPKAGTGNKIGITGYLEQFVNDQDLQSFYADQRPDAIDSTYQFISVDGGLNNQTLSEAGAEANLDAQFAFGLAHPIPGVFYSTSGRPPFIHDVRTPDNTNEPYQDWLDYVLNEPALPRTLSTSYGDDEQTVPESYAMRACRGFAQLGARGVSVLFSSGDSGVGDGNQNPQTQKCFSNDGRNVTRFLPVFPASCPYVTTIGGTDNIPETAVSFSGGGFSNVFERPAYQQTAVSTYLNALPNGTYAGLFNSSGRAYPDLAAQSERFRIFLGGKPVFIGGTSASAPTVAGIVSLLNDARILNNQPPLGFLNPLIYQHADALNDITLGNNPGCGTPGFYATAGWDPVTGLGTPNFGKLKDVVLSVNGSRSCQ